MYIEKKWNKNRWVRAYMDAKFFSIKFEIYTLNLNRKNGKKWKLKYWTVDSQEWHTLVNGIIWKMK